MADEEVKIQKKTDDHVIFVGSKPFMNYVTGVVMQFTTQEADKVVVKARGKFISRCVDIVEVVTKRFLQGNVGIDDNGIKIDSEGFTNKEGRPVRVSSIEVTLIRKK